MYVTNLQNELQAVIHCIWIWSCCVLQAWVWHLWQTLCVWFVLTLWYSWTVTAMSTTIPDLMTALWPTHLAGYIFRFHTIFPLSWTNTLPKTGVYQNKSLCQFCIWDSIEICYVHCLNSLSYFLDTNIYCTEKHIQMKRTNFEVCRFLVYTLRSQSKYDISSKYNFMENVCNERFVANPGCWRPSQAWQQKKP